MEIQFKGYPYYFVNNKENMYGWYEIEFVCYFFLLQVIQHI